MLETSLEKITELYKKGYSLEIIYILKLIEQGIDIDELYKNIPKFGGIVQTCFRKNLITNSNILSLEGKSILDFLSSDNSVKLVKKKPKDDDFAMWWAAYSSTDTFEYKGRKFQGTRALRTKKDDCKIKLNKILSEGEYKISELIAALELEIQQKKDQSVKTGLNKLSYLQNSLTYLNQRSYEGYIDLIRSGHKVKEETQTNSIETYI